METRDLLVQKALELIDHYADSGDVTREELAAQIVDASLDLLAENNLGGFVLLPLDVLDRARDREPPHQLKP